MMTKKVNIYPKRPIVTLNPPIRSAVVNVTKTTEEIYKCLITKAIVDEILPDGTIIRLTFENYDKINEDYGYEEDANGDLIIYDKPVLRGQQVNTDEYNECDNHDADPEICDEEIEPSEDEYDPVCYNKVNIKTGDAEE